MGQNEELVQMELVSEMALKVWDMGIAVPEFHNDPMYKILRSKLKYSEKLVQLGKIVPDGLIVYCINCAEGNPGIAQLILKEILSSNKRTVKSCIKNGTSLPIELHKMAKVTTVLGQVHPFMSIPEVYDYYSKLWLEQKVTSREGRTDNKVNTAEYWEEVL